MSIELNKIIYMLYKRSLFYIPRDYTMTVLVCSERLMARDEYLQSGKAQLCYQTLTLRHPNP